MGNTDYYYPGGYNVICDRTGFKIKSSQAKKEWTNAVVREGSWEERHPQDFVRAVPDNQQVEDARPPQEVSFLSVNQVTTTDFNQTGTVSSGLESIWDNSESFWDNFQTLWDTEVA